MDGYVEVWQSRGMSSFKNSFPLLQISQCLNTSNVFVVTALAPKKDEKKDDKKDD